MPLLAAGRGASATGVAGTAGCSLILGFFFLGVRNQHCIKSYLLEAGYYLFSVCLLGIIRDGDGVFFERYVYFVDAFLESHVVHDSLLAMLRHLVIKGKHLSGLLCSESHESCKN